MRINAAIILPVLTLFMLRVKWSLGGTIASARMILCFQYKLLIQLGVNHSLVIAIDY